MGVPRVYIRDSAAYDPSLRRQTQRQGNQRVNRSLLRGRVPYTELRHDRKEILATIQHENYLIRTEKGRETDFTRSSNEYCHFHRQAGHSTNNCTTLKSEIERLIGLGYLTDFLMRRDNSLPPRSAPAMKPINQQTEQPQRGSYGQRNNNQFNFPAPNYAQRGNNNNRRD